ncbi:hypothetical protein GW17_00025810 [Ensete ventricosum]|nr:hypothetical protein GW17_00025810 [Ensete ventricosum]RZS07139.1 hypothetical protein BHM03_00037928 [Ensete ventricosum]
MAAGTPSNRFSCRSPRSGLVAAFVSLVYRCEPLIWVGFVVRRRLTEMHNSGAGLAETDNSVFIPDELRGGRGGHGSGGLGLSSLLLGGPKGESRACSVRILLCDSLRLPATSASGLLRVDFVRQCHLRPFDQRPEEP